MHPKYIYSMAHEQRFNNIKINLYINDEWDDKEIVGQMQNVFKLCFDRMLLGLQC